MDRGIRETENRTKIHTHLLTTMQRQNRRVPQIPQSYNSQTTRNPRWMGRPSVESHSSIQLFLHRIIRSSTIFPYIWMWSSSKTHPTRIRNTKILGNRRRHDHHTADDKILPCSSRTSKEPEKLKIGDNILIRDHTSKAFQPKYKDFCIVGLLGKNQVEIKDNHGHTTKVHRRDVKKIPMTEKVCQLYEEEQVGKTREGRKAVPASKMPDLGWDIAETQLQKDWKNIETQDKPENNTPHITPSFQVLITVAIIITAILEHIAVYVKEIPRITKKTVQTIKSMTIKASRNKFLQNIKENYKTAALVINIAISMTDRTNRSKRSHTTKGKKPGHATIQW